MSLYTSGEVPENYKCGDCGIHGVKLWREYNTFLDHQTLRCAKCAVKNQKKEVRGEVDDEGCITSSTIGHRTDQIGWLVPAVPTEENDTYWGYTSVPQPGVDWWRKLPTRPPAQG